ncbi:MAG: hypothetical protein R2838_00810 [Caldilineaceae bacterium]
MTDVLLAIPSGELSVRTFFETMAALGLEKEHYVGVGDRRSPPWDVVCRAASAKITSTTNSSWPRDETGLSCPPDSAGCLSARRVIRRGRSRYGENAARPVPRAAKGGPLAPKTGSPGAG